MLSAAPAPGTVLPAERAAIADALAPGHSAAHAAFARHSDGARALARAALAALQGKLAALNTQHHGACALLMLKRAAVERLGALLLPGGGGSAPPRALGPRVSGRVTRAGVAAVGQASGWFLTAEEEEVLWRGCLEAEAAAAPGAARDDEVAAGEAAAAAAAEARPSTAAGSRGRSFGGGGSTSLPRDYPPQHQQQQQGGGGGGAGASVCLSTLFRVVRGAMAPEELPAPRRAAIAAAWERLWRAAHGSASAAAVAATAPGAAAAPPPAASAPHAAIALATIACTFAAAGHPEVKANVRSPEAVLEEFQESFGVRVRAPASSVARAEFFEYYADVSHGTPGESVFVGVLEGVWPAPHAVGSAAVGSVTVAPGGQRGVDGSVYLTSAATGGRLPSQPATAASPAFLAALAQAGGAPEAALRLHLAKVCDASVAYLAYALRRVDVDGDGCVGLEEFRAALRDTVVQCTDAGGALAQSAVPVGGEVFLRSRRAAPQQQALPQHAGADAPQLSQHLHPLLLSEHDSAAVFAALLRCCRRAGGAGSLLPLAEGLEALRGPHALKPSRASLIASLFAHLDSRRAGKLPIQGISAAFQANSHPRCAAGRSNPALYNRIFRDSFVEGCSLVQERGGGGARLRGGPAGEAYYGTGEVGFATESFFTEWCAGLSACYAAPAEDGDFALTLSALWSGKQLSGSGAAGREGAAADRCRESEEDLAEIMGRMGALGGPAGRWSSAQMQHAAAAAQQPPGAAATASPVRSSFTRDQRVGGEGMSKSMSGLLPGPASAAKGGGGAGARGAGFATLNAASPTRPTTAAGGRGDFMGSEAHYMQHTQLLQHHASGAQHAPPAAAPALSASFLVRSPPSLAPLLGEMLAVLQRKGPKASYRLLAALERASAQCAGGRAGTSRSTLDPAPLSAVFACLRDAGCALDAARQGALAQAFAAEPQQLASAGSSYGSVECYPWEVLSAIHGGGLTGARAAVADKAWARLCVLTRSGWGESPAGGHGTPTLADVRILAEGLDESKRKVQTGAGFAAHPEVRAGKRSAEDVEREFLETFAGPTIVGGEQGQGGGASALLPRSCLAASSLTHFPLSFPLTAP